MNSLHRAISSASNSVVIPTATENTAMHDGFLAPISHRRETQNSTASSQHGQNSFKERFRNHSHTATPATTRHLMQSRRINRPPKRLEAKVSTHQNTLGLCFSGQTVLTPYCKSPGAYNQAFLRSKLQQHQAMIPPFASDVPHYVQHPATHRHGRETFLG